MSAPTRADRDWRQLAACTSVDPELFFPPVEDGKAFEAQVRQAKSVCSRCPVIDTCRDFALNGLAHGIAGGLTAEERRVRRTADVGRAQIADGRRPAVVGLEFGVSKRTAQRWAARARTTAMKEGSHGCNRAPLGISQSNTQAGTATEGHRS